MPILVALCYRKDGSDQAHASEKEGKSKMAQVKNTTDYHSREECQGILQRANPCTGSKISSIVQDVSMNSHLGWVRFRQKVLFVVGLEDLSQACISSYLAEVDPLHLHLHPKR